MCKVDYRSCRVGSGIKKNVFVNLIKHFTVLKTRCFSFRQTKRKVKKQPLCLIAIKVSNLFVREHRHIELSDFLQTRQRLRSGERKKR